MNANDTVAVVRDSLTTARDSLAGVHMNTPPDAIARNGRARRRWHRLTGLTGAMAVMARTALAVTALAPSGHTASQPGHPASHPRPARLAAWTVAKQADGDIEVTIRQLSDPSGLQSTLRANGVPANVTSLAQHDPSCQALPPGPGPLHEHLPSSEGCGIRKYDTDHSPLRPPQRCRRADRGCRRPAGRRPRSPPGGRPSEHPSLRPSARPSGSGASALRCNPRRPGIRQPAVHRKLIRPPDSRSQITCPKGRASIRVAVRSIAWAAANSSHAPNPA